MMDKGLLDGLSVLLCNTPPQWALDEGFRRKGSSAPACHWRYCPDEKFLSAFRREHPERSGVEARGILRMLREEDGGGRDIFTLILTAARDYLRMDGPEARCRHEKMVEWRQATRQTGQSVFLCAFLAAGDLASGRVRQEFAFAPYVRTDYLRLRHMLDKGMAENHFHLRGSGPAAFLSWICLMNQVQNGAGSQGFRNPRFQRALARSMGDDGEDAPEPGRFAASRAEYLYGLTNTAAYLRVMLWRTLEGTETAPPGDWFPGTSRPWDMRDRFSREEWVRAVQKKIDPERMLAGERLDYLQAGMAVPGPEERRAYYALSGEHRFLYRMFRRLFQDAGWRELYGPAFYAYLLIFFRFRRELIQCGEEYGFDNFQSYQGRKGLFLTGCFQTELVRSAFLSALDNPSIRSLEARVILGETERKLNRNLERYIRAIPMGREDPKVRDPRAFFVVHLPKRAEEPPPAGRGRDEMTIPCRHWEYREKHVAPQVQALVSLFRRGSSMAARVYGLDACSQEIACRPEVFAPMFRYARMMAVPAGRTILSGPRLPTLRFTYHVGEDFLDVVDGLRAIDEAVRFLELRRGDRLGHALAMGLDPETWYKKRDFNMVLPAQDVLDNTAWLLYALRRMEAGREGGLEAWLQWQFDILCAEIYGGPIPLIRYRQAWRLRGDDPLLYRDRLSGQARLQPWRRSSNPRHEALRVRGSDTWELYRRYHFDPEARRRGAALVSHCPPDEYAGAVRRVQRDLQRRVARLGLGIETNPSSNVLISSVERYDQHPIVAFNDLYLNTPPKGESLFVSINTDDQGIFDTDLENEFALMACALENAKDPDGRYRYGPEQVYRWLDQVRQMGMEQSFRQNEGKELSAHGAKRGQQGLEKDGAGLDL